MTDQVETKQVTWEDFEVAEEQDLNRVTIHDDTEWLEGEEPVPSGPARIRGVLIIHSNISLDQWNKALEEAAKDYVEANPPIYKYAGSGQFRLISGVPPCTAFRGLLTGAFGDNS